MTQYNELFKQQKKDKALRKLSAAWHEWKENGETICGMLVSTNTVPSQLGGGEYKQYLFSTDDGLVKCALGRATDSEAGALLRIGGVYHIQFDGQEKLSNNRRLNKFTINEVQAPAESPVGGSGDVPF